MKNMVLGMPVVDGHENTYRTLQFLRDASTTDLQVHIFDNASETPYDLDELAKYYPRKNLHLTKFKENIGYYKPLRFLYADHHKDALALGLIHNDLYIYEHGWDQRMIDAFENDQHLGLVGLCGSSEIDALGGRGAGTMCFFRGAYGEGQKAGARIHGLEPALILDSLFMMFRTEVVPKLEGTEEDWDNLPLGHFYDRIWPCRTIEAGFRVAILGIECDHEGGVTMTGNMRYREDCIKWLADRNYMDYENPETEMYLLAERRFLSEYRDEKRFLPAIVGKDYAINYLAR